MCAVLDICFLQIRKIANTENRYQKGGISAWVGNQGKMLMKFRVS